MSEIKISQINGYPIRDAELETTLNEKVAAINTSISGLTKRVDGISSISSESFSEFKETLEAWKKEHQENADKDHNSYATRLDNLTSDVNTLNNEVSAINDGETGIKAWVTQQGYLTEHQDLTNINNKLSALDEQVKLISGDDTALDTFSEVKEALANKVESSDFETYKTAVQQEFLLKASLEDLTSVKDSVSAVDTLIKKNEYEIIFAGYNAATSNFTAVVYADSSLDESTATTVTSEDDTFTAISKKGVVRFNGTGKFYFKVTPKDGYKITRVKVSGEYDDATSADGMTYTITDIRSDLEIEVTAVSSDTQAFTVQFNLAHGSVKAYSDKFATPFDDVSAISVESGNNVYFELVPDTGYTVSLSKSNISGSYKNLKVNADEGYGNDNMYGVTKITSNVVISPVFTATPMKLSDYAIDDAYTKTEVDEKLSGYYGKSEVYTKDEIAAKLVGLYRYQGSVATYADLPTENLTKGDVYNVVKDGIFKSNMNYAWNGEDWDSLGSIVDLTDYSTTAQADAKYATLESVADLASKADVSAISTKLPDVPETEGTYVLKAVRTADRITYSWVVETAA